jgi:hypothetical protein
MRTITTEAEQAAEIRLVEADIEYRKAVINACAAEADAEFVNATAWLEQELRWMRSAKPPFIIHEETVDGRKLLEVEFLGR